MTDCGIVVNISREKSDEKSPFFDTGFQLLTLELLHLVPVLVANQALL